MTTMKTNNSYPTDDAYIANNSRRVQEVCEILNIEILSEAAWPTAIGWSFEASTFTGAIRYTPKDDRLVFLVDGWDPRGLTAEEVQSTLLANVDRVTAIFDCPELSVDIVKRFKAIKQSPIP